MSSESGSVRELARELWPLLVRERWTLAGLVLLSIPTGFVEAGVVALVAEAAVTMAGGSSELAAEFGPVAIRMALSSALAVAFGLAVARLCLRLATTYLPARMVANTSARLRTDIFDHFTRASWAMQSQERGGQLQEIITTQVDRVGRLLAVSAHGLAAALMFAGLAASAFLVNPAAAVLMLAFGVVMFVVLRPLARIALGGSTSASAASVDLAAAVNEAVRVGEEHHVFGTGQAQSEAVAERVEEVRLPYLRAMFAGRAGGDSYQGLVFILLVGGLAALQFVGVGDLGAVGATVLILLRSLAYGQQAQNAYTLANDHLPYLRRALAARDRYRAAVDVAGDRELSSIERLAFDDVTYSYVPGEEALSGVSFEITAGASVGIVGPSGAGKSTLVQILLRLRLPDAGSYTVNGVEAHRYAADDWEQRVTYVPQEPRLIHATVADNIRFHRDWISDEAVERAARAAHIHEEIVGWSGGYERQIGQRADAVSGGQRQRLCLARALVTEPELLVLDEPTSALDSRSERLIQQTLQELSDDGVTVFIIAHRSLTLELVDAVLVLDGGRRIGFGPPAEVALDGGELITDLLDASGVALPHQA